jgi:enoyl-CoA hydratase
MGLVVDHPAEGVLRLRLDAPEVRNAISQAMANELESELSAAAADPATRVIVVTGTDPAFCAGIDLRDISAGRRVPLRFFDVLAEFPKPVVGAINGMAATGGFELALACHLRVGSSSAEFVDRHAQLNLIPGGGMSARLVRLVGPSKAIELSFLGRRIGAAEAHRLGLLDQVIEHDRLAEASLEVAGSLVSLDPELTRRLLGLYLASADRPLAEALRAERAAADEWRATRDHSDALSTFKTIHEGSGARPGPGN